MNFDNWFIAMPFVSIILVGIAWTIEDAMYRKKFGPLTTKVKCPQTGKPLKDFELFHGHCLSCKFKNRCKEIISKDNNGTKNEGAEEKS